MREAGLPPSMAGIQARGFVERLAGDNEAAAEYLRQGAEQYRQQADRRFLSTAALNLVFVLLDLDQVDEAEEWLEEAIAEMNAADVVDVAGSYVLRGHIAALRGDHEQGVELAQRAVEIAEQTDFFEVHANTYIEQGHVLALAGRREEAAAAYERALAAARDKGATAWEAKIEAFLAEL